MSLLSPDWTQTDAEAVSSASYPWDTVWGEPGAPQMRDDSMNGQLNTLLGEEAETVWKPKLLGSPSENPQRQTLLGLKSS